MRRGFILAAAAACALIGVQPAAAQSDEVPFTGTTRVDAAVIRDAVQEILYFAPRGLKCDTLTGVEASLLPESWTPADPNFRIGPPGTRYERWDVSLCGRVERFLLGFWTAPDGGTLFQVGYPLPADAPTPLPRP